MNQNFTAHTCQRTKDDGINSKNVLGRAIYEVCVLSFQRGMSPGKLK